MTLNSHTLDQIAAQTLAHHERNTQSFWQGTHDHDVRQNIFALLYAIEAALP